MKRREEQDWNHQTAREREEPNDTRRKKTPLFFFLFLAVEFERCMNGILNGGLNERSKVWSFFRRLLVGTPLHTGGCAAAATTFRG